MKKIIIKVVLLITFTTFFNLLINAQFPDDDPPDDPDPEIPLDPGSWILAAAGVGYGVKKWRDAKRKGNKNDATATTIFLEDDIHKK
ncbi:hypothetical protein [Parafilimonas sp.]|uniref:hypothetical protein n=1 Tax=Parafilimonas sp. TaxID=1969739 RepID=UPI003F7F324E